MMHEPSHCVDFKAAVPVKIFRPRLVRPVVADLTPFLAMRSWCLFVMRPMSSNATVGEFDHAICLFNVGLP